MILVTLNETGDNAEADTPEAAIFAAKTLADDALRGYCGAGRRARIQGSSFSFRFEVEGEVVGGFYALPESALYTVKI